MKCPKCGYTSFDYLDSCKKCNNALGEYKAKYGLRSLLFPHRTQQPIATVAAAALPAALAATETSASTDFGYDFDSETSVAAPAAVSAAGSQPTPAAPVADSFDFDSDWDAPAVAPAEAAEDSFDFVADSPEANPGFAGLGDDLDLDLEDALTPAPAAEETAFEFDDSWGESAPEQAPATVTGLGEEALPEFAAVSFDFAADSADDAITFNGEFDFTDGEIPDLLDKEPAKTTAGKPGSKEGPSDPFDQRESAPVGPAPVKSTTLDQTLADPLGPPAALATDPEASSDKRFAAPANAAEVEATAPLTEPADPQRALVEALPLREDKAPPLPLAEIQPTAQTARNRLKPTGAPFLRLGAGAVDLLLLALIYGLFLAAGKLALFPADQAMAPIPLEALTDLAIPYFLILFALCFGYFTLFHFLSGQTPGKMLFRLKVESASGAPIDFAQAFLRSVGGLISLLCAGLGFLCVLRAPEHRGWNDRLAGTRVIDTLPPLGDLD